MEVKVILNLNGRADEIKGYSVEGGQCKEMSSSSAFYVFIIKRLPEMCEMLLNICHFVLELQNNSI